MDNDVVAFLGVVVIVFATIAYAIKRNFDENVLYIQQGYHQVSGTNSVWIKGDK